MLEFIVSGQIPFTNYSINLFGWFIATIVVVTIYLIYRTNKWYKHVDRKILQMFDFIERQYKNLNKKYQLETKAVAAYKEL